MLTLNVSTWNHPRVSVITPSSFPGWSGTKDIIHPGDLLHVDFGITSMNMNTDVQHMAYVLRPSETDAPVGLKEGLMKANRMQEIVLGRMRVGKTGNEVLRECLGDMRKEGISGQVYSHPIGDWGHSAGAVIGESVNNNHLYICIFVFLAIRSSCMCVKALQTYQNTSQS